MTKRYSPPVSVLFHKRTKIKKISRHVQMEPFQNIGRDIPHGHNYIELPDAPSMAGGTLSRALLERRSTRDFLKKPLTLRQVSSLLFYSYGVQPGEWVTRTIPRRMTPSAGAIYSIDLYPVVLNVTELRPGVYSYDPYGHSLFLKKTGNFSGRIAKLSGGQELAKNASMVLVMSAVFDKMRMRYGERGYRYCLIDAGHIGQNLYLVAASLGLGVVTVGGFIDDQANLLTGVDGIHEAAIYMAALGVPIR